MNKKAIYSILSTIVAMVVLSVSLVFAIGPRVSAYNDENRILVLKDWDDFNWEYHPWLYSYAEYEGYKEVCFGISSSLLDEYFGYEYENCEDVYFGHSDKIINYDEIHVLIPEGATAVGANCFSILPMEMRDKITCISLPGSLVYLGSHSLEYCENLKSIIIPESVNKVGNDVFQGCTNLKSIYCECSEEYANEHWYYDSIWGPYCDAQVIWNCNKTIAFDTEGGSTVENQVVCVDSLISEPIAPTKDGYEFKGWLLNGEPYGFATPVTEDMTLTAKWEEVQPQPEPETPVEENDEINNQNNAGLIAGIAGTSAGILIVAGIVVGIVIAKRRRK